MLVILLLYLGLCQAQAQNLTGSLDDRGLCHCSMNLPDTYFPADRMELLELANQKLSISVQDEITKMQSYQFTLTGYIEKLKNLTRRVDMIETGGVTYTELEFQLLKTEINDMESLVVQLRASINGSNALVDDLFVEIHNISTTVNKLEKFDKNNVLVVRREVASLQKRLKKCQDNGERIEVNYGSCKHGGIKNISKPFVVQLNYRGFSYKAGGWGKDSFLGANQDKYWVSILENTQYFSRVRLFSNYDDLLLSKNTIDKTISSSGNGAGMILYNNSLYYNYYNTRDLGKFNMETNSMERRTLQDAAYNNQFSYSSSMFQDMDFAGDENGLWVIYATEHNFGNVVISKLDPVSLIVEKSWYTSQYKPSITNAFMVCGVLYATRAFNTRKEEIFYMYDTKTNTEGKLSITLDKIMETIQSLSYNPNDHKLYMFSDGYQVNYNVVFNQLPGEEHKVPS
ncbi:olfactomedin-4-like isoform 2-T2 [Discoglossus pictus]